MNSLYILTPDAYLTLDGENVVVKKDGAEMGRFPLHSLEQIVTFSYMGASPALMGKCAEQNKSLSFFCRQPKISSLQRYSTPAGYWSVHCATTR